MHQRVLDKQRACAIKIVISRETRASQRRRGLSGSLDALRVIVATVRTRRNTAYRLASCTQYRPRSARWRWNIARERHQ
jgi:hypothetical protein